VTCCRIRLAYSRKKLLHARHPLPDHVQFPLAAIAATQIPASLQRVRSFDRRLLPYPQPALGRLRLPPPPPSGHKVRENGICVVVTPEGRAGCGPAVRQKARRDLAPVKRTPRLRDSHCIFECHRALIAYGRMPALSVVKQLDITEKARPGFSARSVIFKPHTLGLERMEEALHGSIVPAVAFSAHAAYDA